MRPARRIVSLVPSLTEALFDLGGGERVVGVTDYCISPPAAGERARVGGPRDADIERILSLRPDRILVGREETSRSSVAALCARGARVELIDCRSYQDALELVGALGELCEQEAAAAGAVQRLTAALRNLTAQRRDLTAGSEAPKRVFYPIWRNPWMTLSRASFAADMLALTGGVSIFHDEERPYPTVELAEAVRREPEVILLPDEPYRFTPADRELFRAFDACERGAIRCVPGRWAAWYGTRMDEGLAGLHEALHGSEE